jgi:AraC-like DNA-binding protein
MPKKRSMSKNDLIPMSSRNPPYVGFPEFDRRGDCQIHECGYQPLGPQWPLHQLCNPFWRLYNNAKPGSYIELNGERHPLLPDEIAVIPENTPFSSRNGAGIPHLWIHFSPPFTARFTPAFFTIPVDDVLHLLIRQLQMSVLGPRKALIDRQRILHASLALLHCCLKQSPLEIQPPLPSSLSLILDNVERSLASPPSNGIMAQQAGMCVQGFARWFKHHLGASPARYVAQRRVREACRLLSLTDGSIEAISEAVGFANRYHFSRVFQQYTSHSPAQFRRLQKTTEA